MFLVFVLYTEGLMVLRLYVHVYKYVFCWDFIISIQLSFSVFIFFRILVHYLILVCIQCSYNILSY